MLFTASSTTLQFTLLGMIDWEKNFMLPLIGAVGAACGQQLIGRLVKRYNRQSLIIFPVAGIIGLSAVLMGYTLGKSKMSIKFEIMFEIACDIVFRICFGSMFEIMFDIMLFQR